MDETLLYMTFKNALGNKFTISLNDPREDLTEQEIITAMNLVKEKAIFLPGGYEITETVSAKVVTSNTVEYDLKV